MTTINSDSLVMTSPVTLYGHGGRLKVNPVITEVLATTYNSRKSAFAAASYISGEDGDETEAICIMEVGSGEYRLFGLSETGVYDWRNGRTGRTGTSLLQYRSKNDAVIALVSGDGRVMNCLGKKRWYN